MGEKISFRSIDRSYDVDRCAGIEKHQGNEIMYFDKGESRESRLAVCALFLLIG